MGRCALRTTTCRRQVEKSTIDELLVLTNTESPTRSSGTESPREESERHHQCQQRQFRPSRFYRIRKAKCGSAQMDNSQCERFCLRHRSRITPCQHRSIVHRCAIFQRIFFAKVWRETGSPPADCGQLRSERPGSYLEVIGFLVRCYRQVSKTPCLRSFSELRCYRLLVRRLDTTIDQMVSKRKAILPTTTAASDAATGLVATLFRRCATR